MESPVANGGLGSPIQCCVREIGWGELLTVHAHLVMALEWHWCPSRGWRHVTEEEWRLQIGIEVSRGVRRTTLGSENRDSAVVWGRRAR